MNKLVSLSALTGVIIVLAFAVHLNYDENNANAQTTPFPSREKVISVTGTATASVDPDLLIIQFGVETQEKTARDALNSNSALMNSVVDSIKSAGISEDEISTSRFNIHSVYEGYEENGRWKQELVGYQVTNTVSVETTKLDSAADIIDNAVTAGVNRVDSVYFTLSPETQLQVKDDLIAKAISNAKTKAENALAPLNHNIIGVKAVSLSEFGIPYPQPVFAGAFDMAESASFKSAPPVFSSDQDITTSANVVFLIGSN